MKKTLFTLFIRIFGLAAPAHIGLAQTPERFPMARCHLCETQS